MKQNCFLFIPLKNLHFGPSIQISVSISIPTEFLIVRIALMVRSVQFASVRVVEELDVLTRFCHVEKRNSF